MVKKTDLEKCKEIAKNMLESIPPKEVKVKGGKTKISPFVIELFRVFELSKIEKYEELLKKYKVPFYDVYTLLEFFNLSKSMSKELKGMILGVNDVYYNREIYILAKVIFKDIIDNITSFDTFALYVREQYALIFLQEVEPFISLKDYNKYLITTFVDRGDSVGFLGVTKVNMSIEEKIKQNEKYLELFRKTNRNYLMNSKDLNIYNHLESEVTIYRGLADFNKDYVLGMSWTLNKDVAEKIFANVEVIANGIAVKSNTLKGDVYQAKIRKEDIFVYYNGRSEHEVIVDYTKLYDIKLLPKE